MSDKIIERKIDSKGRVILPIKDKKKVFIKEQGDLFILSTNKDHLESFNKDFTDADKITKLENLKKWFLDIEELELDVKAENSIKKLLDEDSNRISKKKIFNVLDETKWTFLTKQIFLDTTAFFGSKKELFKAITEGWQLFTSPIVVYEFYKIISLEFHKAQQQQKTKRSELLKSLEERFILFLSDISVNIIQMIFDQSFLIKTRKVQELYDLDIGDALNYVIMKDNNLSIIVSSDKDWNRVPGITNILELSELNPDLFNSRML